jgi:regulator of sigma E protease
MLSVIIFIIILGVLVFIHEAGHFLTAKLFKVRVDEFGMGFPPRAVKLFKKGETEYTLNWIPFGGFVKIYGEDALADGVANPDYKRSLVAQKWWKQIIILIAGVTMNMILAWILISGSLMIGAPTPASSVPNPSVLRNPILTVLQVEPSSPAEAADLRPGDKILKATSPEEILSNATPDVFTKFVQTTKPGDTIALEIERGATIKNISVTPNEKIIPGSQGIGIALDIVGTYKLGFFSAIGNGFLDTWYSFSGTLHAFWQLIAGSFHGKNVLSEVTGPVGLVGVVSDARQIGFTYLLMLSAIISINLAIVNMIPFPALDGGRILFVLIEKITRRKLPQKFVEWANGIGFALLILLMIVVTVKDVIHLF